MPFNTKHINQSCTVEQEILFSFLILLVQLLLPCVANAQKQSDGILPDPYSPDLSPMLSTHPFGVYYGRIAPNFKYKTASKYSLSFELNNGNIWLPPVKAYVPITKADQEYFSNYVWHHRYGELEGNPVPVDSFALRVDAVYHVIYAGWNQVFKKKHELQFRLRAFRIDKGDSPATILTSDKAIEWFHSDIQGQEDPFARKIYGLNKVQFDYTDRNGKSLSPKPASWHFPGMEVAYYYYLQNNSTGGNALSGNFGTKLGVNFGPVNPSVDLALAGNMLKRYLLTQKQRLHVSMHLGLLQKGLIKRRNTIELSNSPRQYNFHLQTVWEFKTKATQRFFAGLGYNIHSPYNHLDENSYIIFDGVSYTPHWKYALGHLYRFDFSWNLQLSYSWDNTMFSFFMREDIPANNAPDIQTGLRLVYNFSSSLK